MGGEGRDLLSRCDRGGLWEEERGGALNDPIPYRLTFPINPFYAVLWLKIELKSDGLQLLFLLESGFHTFQCYRLGIFCT